MFALCCTFFPELLIFKLKFFCFKIMLITLVGEGGKEGKSTILKYVCVTRLTSNSADRSV